MRGVVLKLGKVERLSYGNTGKIWLRENVMLFSEFNKRSQYATNRRWHDSLQTLLIKCFTDSYGEG